MADWSILLRCVLENCLYKKNRASTQSTTEGGTAFGYLITKRARSELSHVPERSGVIQTGEDILYNRSFSAVFQPALFYERPQLVVEPKARRRLRFPRPAPLRDYIQERDVILDFVVWVVPAQDLGEFRRLASRKKRSY